MPAPLLNLYDWVVASYGALAGLNPSALTDIGKIAQVRNPVGTSDWYRFDGYDGAVQPIWTPYVPLPRVFANSDIDEPAHQMLLHGKFTIEWTPTADSWEALQTTCIGLMRWGGQRAPGAWGSWRSTEQADFDALHNSFILDRWHWSDGSHPDMPTLVYFGSASDHWINDDGSIGEDAWGDYIWYLNFQWVLNQRISFTLDLPAQTITIAGAAEGYNGTYQSRETRSGGSSNLYLTEFGTGGDTPAGNPYQLDTFRVSERLLNVYTVEGTHWESREDLGDGSITVGRFAPGWFPAVPPVEGVLGPVPLAGAGEVALALSAAPAVSTSLTAQADIALDLGAPSITRLSCYADASLQLAATPAALGVAAQAQLALGIAAAPTSSTARAAAELSLALAATPRSTSTALAAAVGPALALAAQPARTHPLGASAGTSAALWLSATPRLPPVLAGGVDLHCTLAAARPTSPLGALGAQVALGLVVGTPETRDVNHPLVALPDLGVALAFTAAPQVLGEEPPPVEVKGNHLLMMFL